MRERKLLVLLIPVVSTSNRGAKITTTEFTKNTEDFFSVVDNIIIDLYRLPLDLKWIHKFEK